MTPVVNCRRYQWPAVNLPPVSTTPAANFPTSSSCVVDTPAANLPLVSTTPVANCHRYQRHRRQICHRYHWHRWQIIGKISGCRHLKVNLKAKIYIYVSSTTQRWPNKIIKIYPIEDTGGKPWAANISANFRKNSRRYSQLKVDHRYQRHRWQIIRRYQLHQRQILPPVSLVLLTPVANNWINIRLQIP
jgi:hypothetical protein